MNENQISEGLQMMAKFFAIKTQAPDAPAIVEVPPVAPTMPQTTVSVPVIQSPPVKPYEPIGRGRGAKTLLGVLIGAAVLYFLGNKYFEWKNCKKES
jgi:hypothetical protein